MVSCSPDIKSAKGEEVAASPNNGHVAQRLAGLEGKRGEGKRWQEPGREKGGGKKVAGIDITNLIIVISVPATFCDFSFATFSTPGSEVPGLYCRGVSVVLVGRDAFQLLAQGTAETLTLLFRPACRGRLRAGFDMLKFIARPAD